MAERLVIGELVPSEFLVGRRDVALRKSQLLQDDVPRHRNARGLEEGQVTVETLPPEAAVGREDELVGRNALQTAPDAPGNDVGKVGLERPMADDADGDFLLQ